MQLQDCLGEEWEYRSEGKKNLYCTVLSLSAHCNSCLNQELHSSKDCQLTLHESSNLEQDI